MTVDQYLDLAFSVVVDDKVRRGATLANALEETSEWAAGGLMKAALEDVPAGGNRVVPPQNVEAQNDASLDALMGMMSGASGGFH